MDKLADVLSDFASTMLTDSPTQGILDHLVGRVVDVLPVTAAGATLFASGEDPRYVAASNSKALHFERLQTDLGEGPSMDACASGEAVCVPDLHHENRFPGFQSLALQAGLVAVFAFPLQNGSNQFGALDLYRETPGPLETQNFREAKTLADVAAAYLANAKTRSTLQHSLELARDSAMHDSLTGAANRVLLVQLLDQVLFRVKRSDTVSGLLYFDLDQFKRINDIYGHRVGDELLVAVVDRLRGLLRPSDTLARLGGDEFVILCEDLNERSDAELIATRTLRALSAPFTLSIGTVHTTASIGIAHAGTAALSSEDVLHEADLAMYQAKRSGGGQYQVTEVALPNA
jgi:diguanylate cyclase (GGDEF)-like protein